MATNTGFGFDIGLKPIDRTSTQYRDQQIDSKSQLSMMSVEPRMSQIPKANINTNRVRETSQVPMQSTNLGEAFGYIDRNEPDNINYKISDTDDKLAQLRSNMFNIGLSFGFDKQAINPIINKPEFVEGFKEELKNMPFNKKVEYNRAKFGFDTQDMTGPEIAKYISDKKELANAQKGAMYDLSSGMDDSKFDEVYGDISDKKEALKGAIYDLPNIKSPKQFAELYPELDKSIYYSYQYDKLSGKKELVPYSNYRVKGKSIDELDPNFGMFQIAARVVNLAPALYNVAAFVTNAALDGDKFADMMTSLPEGLDYVVGESLKKAQNKEGLGKVMSVMDDLAVFFQENPDIILPQQIPGAIDDIVVAGSKGASKISTSTLVKDAIKYSKEAGKFTLGLVDEAPKFGTKVDNILPKTSEELTKDMINITPEMSTSISKGIKPTVIEKKGSVAIADFEKNVVSSIDTILDNSDAIKYIDELGDEITKTSPETMREFADAIRQAKKIIYEDYAADAAKAGEAGAVVNTQPIIDELTILKDRLSKQIGQQNTIDYIDKTILDIQSKPTLDIMTAQDNVQTFNNQLQAFYRNPNYNDVGRTVVDALVNNILRDKLDAAIETALDSPKYMAKKQRYGALKNIEKEVSKRAVVSERANTRGLIDFTDFVSADMAVNGIIRTLGGDVVGGLGSIARGGFLNSIKNLYKKWNSPDYNLQQLIKKVKKAKENGTLYSNKIDNANINSNPVSDIVTLENQKGLAEGQGLKTAKELKQPSNLKSSIDNKQINVAKSKLYNMEKTDNVTEAVLIDDKGYMIKSKLSHAEIANEILGKKVENMSNIEQHVRNLLDETDSIRIIPSANGEINIQMVKKPTPSQIRKISKILSEEGGGFVDLTKVEGGFGDSRMYFKFDGMSDFNKRINKYYEGQGLEAPGKLNKSTLTNDLYNTDFDGVTPRFGNERNYGKISFDEGAGLVKGKLGKDFEVNGLISKDIAGEAYNSKIGLAKTIDKSTPYHEITHTVKRNLKGEERIELIKEVIKDKKITQAEVDAFNKANNSDIDLYEYAEEALADGFYNYLINKPTGLGERITTWFNDLIDRIRGKGKAKQLYKDIDKGKYRGKIIGGDSGVPAYIRINPKENILYRQPVSEKEGMIIGKKNTGMYTTALEDYAKTYGRGEMKAFKLDNSALVYEATDVEELYKKLFNEDLPIKGGTHDKAIESLRKGERKIANELRKQGYDVINYSREMYDNDFLLRYGVEAPSSVILNDKVIKEIPYQKQGINLKELSDKEKAIIRRRELLSDNWKNMEVMLEKTYGGLDNYIKEQERLIADYPEDSILNEMAKKNLEKINNKKIELEDINKKVKDIEKRQISENVFKSEKKGLQSKPEVSNKKGLVNEKIPKTIAMMKAPEDSLIKEARKYKSAEEFIKQMEGDYKMSHEAPNRSDGYAKSLDSLDGIYPDDIYTSQGARYYGDGSPYDGESISIIQSLKNKPNKDVIIYRAVPNDVTVADKIKLYEGHKAYIQAKGKLPPGVDNWNNRSEYYEYISDELDKLKNIDISSNDKISINPGDWITINKKYAIDHGKNNLNGKYKILQKKVKANEIFTDGNSIHEQGYDPIQGGTKSKSQLKQIREEANSKGLKPKIMNESKEGLKAMVKAPEEIVKVYHMTNSSPFIKFKEGKTAISDVGRDTGKYGVYFSDKPDLFYGSNKLEVNLKGVKLYDVYSNEAPIKINAQTINKPEFDWLKKNGYDGVKDSKNNEIAIINKNKIDIQKYNDIPISDAIKDKGLAMKGGKENIIKDLESKIQKAKSNLERVKKMGGNKRMYEWEIETYTKDLEKLQANSKGLKPKK